MKDFIKGLTWWDEVAPKEGDVKPKVPGFPSDPAVWHFHPVALVELYMLLPDEEVSFFTKDPDGRTEVFRGPIPAVGALVDNLGTGGIFYQKADNTEVRLGKKQPKQINGVDYLGLVNDAKAESPSLYQILNKTEYASYINGIALTDRDKRVWTGITDNEGNMQALNQWDNAFLSVGPFQQTAGVTYLKGATMTHYLDIRGELQGAIYSIDRNNSNLVKKYFDKYDLAAVDIKTETGMPKGRFFLRGQPFVLGDKEEFRRLSWAYRFYIALKDVDFCREFLRQGFPRLTYVMSLTREISWNYQPPKPPNAPETAPLPTPVPKKANFNVGTTFGSDLALALILDAHVNRPGCVEKPGAASIWAKAIRDHLIKEKPEALKADDATEWKLIRNIIANRVGAKMTDPGVRAANILRYVKTADLEAMATEFGFKTGTTEEKLTNLVEKEQGFNIKIKKVASAYNDVVKKNHVDVLNGKRT